MKTHIKVVVVFVFLFFFFPLFAYSQEKDAELVKNLLDFLKVNGKPPVDYIIDKFEKHQIVAVGEIHEVENNLNLLIEIVKNKAFIENVGTVVWEFGNSKYQKEINEVMNSENFDEQLISKMYKDYTHPWGWPFECYIDFYRAVWEINKSKKNSIKLILADIPINWEEIKTSEDYSKIADKRDSFMANVIETEIIRKGKKALFYAGRNHTLKNLKMKDGAYRETAVFLLNQNFPNKVFSVFIHHSNQFNDKKKETRRISDGLFDFLFEKRNNEPIGFDLENNFFGHQDQLKIDFITSPFPFNLNDLYDGYLFIGPLESYRHSKIVSDFYDADYFKTVCQRNKMVFGYDLIEKFNIHSYKDFIEILKESGVGNKNLQRNDAWKEIK